METTELATAIRKGSELISQIHDDGFFRWNGDKLVGACALGACALNFLPATEVRNLFWKIDKSEDPDEARSALTTFLIFISMKCNIGLYQVITPDYFGDEVKSTLNSRSSLRQVHYAHSLWWLIVNLNDAGWSASKIAAWLETLPHSPQV